MLKIFLTRYFPYLDNHQTSVCFSLSASFSLSHFHSFSLCSWDSLKTHSENICFSSIWLWACVKQTLNSGRSDELPLQLDTLLADIVKIRFPCQPVGLGLLCLCFGCLECCMGSLSWTLTATCDSCIGDREKPSGIPGTAAGSGWMTIVSPCLGSTAGLGWLLVASFHQVMSPSE